MRPAMFSALKYVEAVIKLAATGETDEALFSRVPDAECDRIAKAIRFDANVRAAFQHPNCAGMVDTYLLTVASA
jgi:hypothetical protein